MTTTRETLARREAGIDEEALPKTFRDAVVLTRSLDVRYLWIDSLCIIQNDDQDWHGQSAQMGTIFGNAFLVIAATRAAHSGEGFLVPRQLGNFRAILLRHYLPRGIPASQLRRPWKK